MTQEEFDKIKIGSVVKMNGLEEDFLVIEVQPGYIHDMSSNGTVCETLRSDPFTFGHFLNNFKLILE